MTQTQIVNEKPKTNIPMTKAHQFLFALRYIDKERGKSAEQVIVDLNAAGLAIASTADLIRIERELNDQIFYALEGDVTPERILYLCPTCITATLVYDRDRDEFVCSCCGLVVDDLHVPDESLSFDQTFHLTSELATDKSNGTPLTPQTYFAVAKGSGFIHKKTNGSNFYTLNVFSKKFPNLVDRLKVEGYVIQGEYAYLLESGPDQKVYITTLADIGAQVLGGSLLKPSQLQAIFHMNDLPMRKMRIKNLAGTGNLELDKILKEGAEIITAFGLPQNYTFGNTVGIFCRKAYHYAKDYKLGTPMRCIAATAFIYSICIANKWRHIDPALSQAFICSYPELAADLEQKNITFRITGPQSSRERLAYCRGIVRNFDEQLFVALQDLDSYFRLIKAKVERKQAKQALAQQLLQLPA